MIFAFLPFMVHDFFPELNTEELGEIPIVHKQLASSILYISICMLAKQSEPEPSTMHRGLYGCAALSTVALTTVSNVY